ncbi:MAG: phage portal protein [Bacteroidaceae bacterium]|nr:phage portal protein [Bacteroidaceae bacterium]
MSFFSNLFKAATPENALMLREAPQTPGVPSSTMPPEPQKVEVGDYMERIVATRTPEAACSVSAVYRAVTLRGDTMSVMPVQYRKKDFERDNFVQDMRGLGKRINYLLQEEANPIMSAPDLWNLVELNRTLTGNGFVYIERDEFGFPLYLWLIKQCGYNINNATYASIVYLTDRGYRTEINVPTSDVLHFPNNFRYPNGWGKSTLLYAFEALTLNRTLRSQALDTAAKGGRIKGIISEKQPQQGVGTLAYGLLNQGEVQKTAQEMQKKFYSGHDIVSMHGLESFQNLSMTAQDMQMLEQLGITYDDVARYWGVPRPLLMLDTNSHYNDYQNATMEFHTRTILPLKNRNEKEIARKLILKPENDPLKYYGVCDIHICEDPLMVMDPERRAKVAQLKMQAGLCTVNEARRDFDMPAVEDGDVPMASANLMTLKALIAKSDASTTLKPGTYTVGEEPNGDGASD